MGDRDPNVQYSFKAFSNLAKRSIIPLLTEPGSAPTVLDVGELPDLNNVQGDVVYLFPKAAENFIFFRINDVNGFKTALKQFKPTSSEDVKNILLEINEAKARVARLRSIQFPSVKVAQYQIAFSRTGLNTLGVKEPTGDPRFDKFCMKDNKAFLGDQGTWDEIFNKPKFDPVNGSVGDDTDALHGVFTVAGKTPEDCAEASKKVIELFGSSMTVSGGTAVEGRARPGEFKGHEHFGFQDGISQPAPRGVVAPRPGQIQVDPGVILMGYKGDPVLDDPNNKVGRPGWTKDGTILVFRKLEQDAIGFEEFTTRTGKRWREFVPGGTVSPPLTDKEGADLFGARLIGRWKSGAPLARCPFRDDPVMAVDPDRNNDFDYVVRNNPNISPNEPSNFYCPFTIHTRKTAPRNLDPYVDKKFLESGSIVRGGLPYGLEITPEERRDYDPTKPSPRGLLFNCYMSSLDSGFIRQTIAFAGNDYFPVTSFIPQKHGQDPIIGGPPPKGSAGDAKAAELKQPYQFKDGDQVDLVLLSNGGSSDDNVSVQGFAKVTKKQAQPPPGADNPFFVTSRGGEYFFVPSIPTLKDWANSSTPPSSSKLDVLFLLDATSSMQKYIDEVRLQLQTLCDNLVGSGKWGEGDLRFGIIAFRDHPPQETTFVTLPYPFETDVGAIQSNLSLLKAQGGGDGPEAQCDALSDALSASWNNDATKIAILITDSPPHGLGEVDDKFPGGCPQQKDPVRSVNRMAKLGITLHVLACEPTLSNEYDSPLDFYSGMAQKTGGELFALSDVKSLINVLTGGVLQAADITQVSEDNKGDIQGQAKQRKSVEQISSNVYSRLKSAGTKVHTFDIESIYEDTTIGAKNRNVWLDAEQIDTATKAKIEDTRIFRIKSEYRSGGRAPPMSTSVQPISLLQVRAAVQKCVAQM